MRETRNFGQGNPNQRPPPGQQRPGQPGQGQPGRQGGQPPEKQDMDRDAQRRRKGTGGEEEEEN